MAFCAIAIDFDINLGDKKSAAHSVDFLPQNYASKSTFYRHLVELSYWCHLKGPCVGSFLGENSVPTFDFERL